MPLSLRSSAFSAVSSAASLAYALSSEVKSDLHSALLGAPYALVTPQQAMLGNMAGIVVSGAAYLCGTQLGYAYEVQQKSLLEMFAWATSVSVACLGTGFLVRDYLLNCYEKEQFRIQYQIGVQRVNNAIVAAGRAARQAQNNIVAQLPRNPIPVFGSNEFFAYQCAGA